MERLEGNNFEHRGVRAIITDDAMRDARDCQGIDLPRLLANAIDRMLYVARQDVGDFAVRVHLHNSSCEPDECIFNIRVFRI